MKKFISILFDIALYTSIFAVIFAIFTIIFCNTYPTHNDEGIVEIPDNMYFVSENEAEDTTECEADDDETEDYYYSKIFECQIYKTQDFDEQKLAYLLDICGDYQIRPEFMIGLIYQESTFKSKAAAKSSSARGYCQIIKKTAAWLYEDVAKLGTYDTSSHEELMFDWELNIKLSCEYVRWLLNNKGGTYQKAAEGYFGSTVAEENKTYASGIKTNIAYFFGDEVANEIFNVEMG